jgi:hypothetical protein
MNIARPAPMTNISGRTLQAGPAPKLAKIDFMLPPCSAATETYVSTRHAPRLGKRRIASILHAIVLMWNPLPVAVNDEFRPPKDKEKSPFTASCGLARRGGLEYGRDSRRLHQGCREILHGAERQSLQYS